MTLDSTEAVPRYGFLGPAGTFTEAALLQWLDGRTAELLPYATVDSAVDAVRVGDVAAAMVPLENSVEGSVAVPLDELAGRYSLEGKGAP